MMNSGSKLTSLRQRMVVITSHPDDESMFFIPSILNYKEIYDIYILCLSSGNYDGLGTVRKNELVKSGQVLGIPSRQITIIEDDRLQDGMENNWDRDVIATIVQNFVHQNHIEMILTFDQYGVSSHPNHISVHWGVAQYLAQHDQVVDAFQLETTNIVRKYMGILDLLLSLVSSSMILLVVWTPWINYSAMAAHHSQFVWYRRLFVIFSRYTFINTVRPFPTIEKNKRD